MFNTPDALYNRIVIRCTSMWIRAETGSLIETTDRLMMTAIANSQFLFVAFTFSTIDIFLTRVQKDTVTHKFNTRGGTNLLQLAMKLGLVLRVLISHARSKYQNSNLSSTL